MMRKTAVITGSTSGIGKAVAEALADSGVNIVLNGFGDLDEIQSQRADLEQKYGIQAHYDAADMTKPDEIRTMIETAATTFGSLDILVNNAGIQHVAPIDEFPTNKWDAIIAINLSSAFHTTAAALPHMRSAGWGRIVNIASAHGLVASPFKSAYVAAKHGVLGLTKTTALETAQDGITCNAICPGYVRTPLVEAQIPDTAKARGITEEEVVRDVILAAQPTKSFVGLDELGALAVFLCSDGAKSITGASLPIDGGWTAK
jgi:3-hydroxybutyrate dehydrogenase